MKKFITTFLVMAMAGLGLHAQWVQKPSGEKIALVLADGKTVTLEPSVINPVDAGGLFSVNWTFRLQGERADVVVSAPVSVDLGEKVSPRSRNLPIQVVRLRPKKGGRIWAMKNSSAGFWPMGDTEVVSRKDRVEPRKDSMGHWILPLPSSMAPGQYAVISDGDIWDFEVK
jgi:hypothetical protein